MTQPSGTARLDTTDAGPIAVSETESAAVPAAKAGRATSSIGLGRDAARRWARPGPPGRARPAPLGSIAAAAARFSAGLTRAPQIRRELAGPGEIRPSRVPETMRPPRWWSPAPEDLGVPGTAVPGTAVPGTAVPGTAVPGTAVPGTAVPGTDTGRTTGWSGARQVAPALPPRGLRRAAQPVPTEKTHVPGGMAVGMTGNAIQVRRLPDVRAAGPMKGADTKLVVPRASPLSNPGPSGSGSGREVAGPPGAVMGDGALRRAAAVPGRRNECALSDRQHVVARRGARADPHDAAREYGVGRSAGRIRNRLRSVTRRVLIIGYEARSPKTREALVKSYRTLMATTRAVLRDAATMVRRLGQRVRTASPQVQPILQRAQDRLQEMRPLVQRVVAQTRARLLGGDTHVPDKVLSVFEPHTETIRKGKIAKPNEFGKLVTIQESEHQIITAYEVHATGRRHLVDRGVGSASDDLRPRPDLAAGDRGFSSANNERATARGVRRVILPRRGPKSPARRAYERQRWFRRGQRWRVGCEGRISVLKRRHGLDRCRYHGEDGMHRWVGLGVIANNLVSTATFSKARATA